MASAPVAAYGFGEGSGTTTADTSGNANHGTLQNGASWGAGDTGTALLLDGSNDFVSIADSASLLTTSLTIEARIKTQNAIGPHMIVFKGRAGGWYCLYTIGSELAWNYSGGSKVHVSRGANLLPGSSHHVAVSFNDDTNIVSLYVDGVQRYSGTESASLLNTGGQLLLGAAPGRHYFSGSLDDVRLYNRSLTQAEIVTDSAISVIPTPPPPPPPPPVPPPAPGTIPQTLGWYELPNTKLRTLCPDEVSIQANEGCAAVTLAWGAGFLDSSRNRLIVRGGGHSTYFGNEIYALNLNPVSIERLTNPSLDPPLVGCLNSGIMPDGKPTSRHLFNHLAYIAHVDRMFSYGGAGIPCGFFHFDTWTLPMGSPNDWQKMSPVGDGPTTNTNTARFGVITEYDPVTRKVYQRDDFRLYAYTYETDSYEALSAEQELTSQKVGIIDTARQLLLIIAGGKLYQHDLAPGSNHALREVPTTGGEMILNAYFPGLAYDQEHDRIVGWDSGDTVYSLDLDTGVWTPVTYLNGPTKVPNGTMGRFRYVPDLGVYAVLNSVDANAYVLRLDGGSGELPPPPPPPPPLPDAGNPLVAYGFDEGSGSLTEDATPNGNSGTLLEGASFGIGTTGSGLLLDGVNDQLRTAASPSLTTTDISIEAWIKKSSITGLHVIASRGESARYQFYTTGSELGWVYSGGDRYHVSSNARLVTGVWYHVAITFNDATNTVKLYVNDVLKYTGSETSSLTGISGPLLIGSGVDAGYFPGNIDDFRLYDGTLTAAQIQLDMSAPVSSSLKAAYAFSEGSGTMTADYSPYHNTGMLYNGAAFGVGRSGTGLMLDGVNDYQSVADSASLAASDITVESWIRLQHSQKNNVIALKGSSAGYHQFYTAAGELMWAFTGSGLFHRTTGANLQTGVWYHVAVSFNNATDTVKLYINGVERYSGSQTRPLPQLAGPLYIGRGLTAGYFLGALDDVRVFDRVRTPAEINSDMANPLP